MAGVYTAIMRRILPPAKEVLEDLYIIQGISARDLSRRFGCSQNTIGRWLVEYNIPRRYRGSPNLEKRIFGRLTVKRQASSEERGKRRGTYWLCSCECGREKIVSIGSLLGKWVSSCGSNEHRFGANSHFWKGGRIVERTGYIKVTVGGETLFEHRVVMEKMLGRPLLKSESVHHKNGIRGDNRPENLELWIVSHPYGQRTPDVVAHALEMLNRYAPEKLKNPLDISPPIELDWSI